MIRLARDLGCPALLQSYKFKVLGNAIPLEVGYVLARAVRQAVGHWVGQDV